MLEIVLVFFCGPGGLKHFLNSIPFQHKVSFLKILQFISLPIKFATSHHRQQEKTFPITVTDQAPYRIAIPKSVLRNTSKFLRLHFDPSLRIKQSSNVKKNSPRTFSDPFQDDGFFNTRPIDRVYLPLFVLDAERDDISESRASVFYHYLKCA